MQSLFQFFGRFGATILFILLEAVCFVLIIKYNGNQNKIFINSSNFYTGTVSDYYNKAIRYSKLTSFVDSLSKENARLRADLRYATINASFIRDTLQDTIYKTRYKYISAEVISNSINQLDNYLTINKGYRMGIKSGMGVISDKGIVGVIKDVTKDYSSVISILSTQTMISGSIKNKGFFGRLIWNHKNVNILNLIDIPKEAKISQGDTVITSGFGTLFPKGIIIGTVKNINIESGTGFLSLDVKLSNNLASTGYVYVIIDQAKPQIDSLQLQMIK